jgi:hypothetical protein
VATTSRDVGCRQLWLPHGDSSDPDLTYRPSHASGSRARRVEVRQRRRRLSTTRCGRRRSPSPASSPATAAPPGGATTHGPAPLLGVVPRDEPESVHRPAGPPSRMASLYSAEKLRRRGFGAASVHPWPHLGRAASSGLASSSLSRWIPSRPRGMVVDLRCLTSP